MSRDNNNEIYDDSSKSKIHNNSNKLSKNDSNNNASSVYDFQSTSYGDQMEDKTNLGLNNNTEDYYKIYDINEGDDRHYEAEFDNEYAQNSITTSKQIMHKQMSILDEDAHQNDEYFEDMMLNEEQKVLDEEYLNEFDEEGTLRVKPSIGNGFMKKQESIMEDDPELKQLEESQNLKNHQQNFQDQELDNELDQFDLELKQKKSVTICDDEEVVHEKPREKRTAKQRWHWAYNRIVHQAQVSKLKFI